MKNNYLWGFLILIAVVLGSVLLGLSRAGYDSMNYGDTKTESNVTPEKTTTTSTKSTSSKPVAPIAGMQTSLGGIFAVSGTYQCDYDSVTQQTRTSNVVYISNGKMRGEFRTISASITQSNIAVYDGTNLYVWIEGRSTGTMSQPKTLADLPGIIPQDVSSGRILGSGLNNVSWYCHGWSLDPSKLVRPSYVTFK